MAQWLSDIWIRRSSREKSLLKVLFVSVTLYTVYQFAWGTVIGTWHFRLTDFTAYYAAAKALSTNHPIYNPGPWPLVGENILSDIPVDEEVYFVKRLYLYPPFLAWLLQPLARLPYVPAERLWSVCIVLAYGIGIVWLLLREFKQQWLDPSETIILGFIALYWAPLFFTSWSGQVTTLVLLLLIAHWICACSKKDVWAGLALGVAILLKVSPILFILFWLFQKRWTLLLSTFGAIVVLIFFSGIKNNIIFATSVLPHLSWGENHPINHSLMGVFLRQVVQKPWGWLAPKQIQHIAASHFGMRCFLLAGYMLTLWGAWKKQDEASLRLGFSAVLLAMIIFSPVSRIYDYVYVFPAVVLLYGILIKHPLSFGMGVWIFTVIANMMNVAGWLAKLAFHPLMEELLGRPSLFSATLLWCITVYLYKKSLYRGDSPFFLE